MKILRKLALAAALCCASFAAHAQVRIMPLGDSITGWSGDGIYRHWLRQELDRQVGTSKYIFVGSMSDKDGKHEGHSGWTSAKIKGRIGEWSKKHDPDVVLIHLGTNDLRTKGNAGVGQTTSSLKNIVATLRKSNPEVVVLLAQIIPAASRWYTAAQHKKLNAEIAKLVPQLNTEKSPVLLVDQSAGYVNSTDNRDGLHPNKKGAQKMSAKWMLALKPFLLE